MIRPDIDGCLAERVRQIADAQLTPLVLTIDGVPWNLTAAEATRILTIAADVFEEYIMAVQAPPHA